jgi:hypothetical protein
MTKVKFHPRAEAEMVAAAAYYESQQENLGKKFLASIQDAINSIVAVMHLARHPDYWKDR